MYNSSELLKFSGGFDDNLPLDSVECYDPKLNTWTMVSSMTCKRGGVGVAALGGKIYAVGGHDGSSYLNTVEVYDPVSDRYVFVDNLYTWTH